MSFLVCGAVVTWGFYGVNASVFANYRYNVKHFRKKKKIFISCNTYTTLLSVFGGTVHHIDIKKMSICGLGDIFLTSL